MQKADINVWLISWKRIVSILYKREIENKINFIELS